MNGASSSYGEILGDKLIATLAALTVGVAFMVWEYILDRRHYMW